MLNKASGKPFKCEQCDYSSNRSFDLRRHEQRHTKIKPLEGTVFKCSECSFVTKWKRNMGRHMATHNKTPVEDPVDDTIVDTIDDTIDDPVDDSVKHLVDDESFEEFIVELIEPESNDVSEIPEIDELGVTYMKLFVCGQCHYTSNRAFDLRRHEQTHSRVKIIDGTAFKCMKCPFITKWKRNMKRHIKKHIELRNELSIEKLNDESSEELIVQLINSDDINSEHDMDAVDNLQSENSESPPSESEIQIFPLPKNETKDNEANAQKRFKCAQCHYESKRAFDLRRHEQRHKKIKIVDGTAAKCTECSFVTKWKRNMRRHMKLHKPKATSPEASILDEQLSELVEEVNYDVESQTLSIEPFESETLISELNSQTITMNEIAILESDENSDVLPSYWQAIQEDEESVYDT